MTGMLIMLVTLIIIGIFALIVSYKDEKAKRKAKISG